LKFRDKGRFLSDKEKKWQHKPSAFAVRKNSKQERINIQNTHFAPHVKNIKKNSSLDIPGLTMNYHPQVKKQGYLIEMKKTERKFIDIITGSKGVRVSLHNL